MLADRIRVSLDKKGAKFEEKKMMGGLCFMVDGKMCVGVIKDNFTARIDPEIYEEALNKKGCSEMTFTGRPLKGYVYVDEDGIESGDELDYWVQLCLDYNPHAKSSKKKKTK